MCVCVCVCVCVLSPQNRYHSTNPYHNHIHAADVLLTTDFLLKAKPLEVVYVHTTCIIVIVFAGTMFPITSLLNKHNCTFMVHV